MPVVTLIVAAVVAVVDWWSVASDRRDVERVAKPLTMAALIAVAATIGDPTGDVRTWLVVGASFGLLGDVALLGDGDTEFVSGLAAFAFGHIAYAIAGLLVGVDAVWLVPGVGFVVVLLGFRFVTRTLPGALRHGGPVLAAAVVVYALVISWMVISAWGSGAWLAAVGAMSFAASDWILGYQRFVAPLPGRRLSVMIPYHVGQALLILGLATS